MDDAKTKKMGDVRQTTLHDEDIVKSDDGVGRRSAVARIGMGFLSAVGAAVGLRPSTAEAQNCTDSDGGPYADQPGYGRHCRVYYRQPVVYVQPQPQGCTDSDGGPYADGGGRGRRCGGGGPVYVRRGRRNSCTDSDSGSYADAAGRGRSCGY